MEDRMVSVRRCAAWATVLGLALMARSASAEQIDNPRYQVWSSFKVGSNSTMTGSMDMGQFKMQLERKQTLTEVADDHVTIEIQTTTNMMGQARPGKPRKETITAKVEKSDVKDLGEETVEAMGKSFKCKVLEFTTEQPAGPGGQMVKADTKVYVTKDVPGGQVKMMSDVINPQNQQHILMTYLLKSFESK